MTIVIAAVVSYGLAIGSRNQIYSLNDSRDNTMAIALAQYEMDRVKNMSYASIVSATTNSYQGYNYDVVRTVTYSFNTSATAESLKRVQIDVRRSGSAVNIYSLYTYISRNVTTGT